MSFSVHYAELAIVGKIVVLEKTYPTRCGITHGHVIYQSRTDSFTVVLGLDHDFM